MDIVLKKYCLLIVSEFFDAYTWNMYALTYLTRRKLAMQDAIQIALHRIYHA